MGFIVAIDGPAGSGKGTVTKIVAEKLGLINIDTGAMYRCVTLKCLENRVNVEDLEGIKQILENIDIKLVKEKDRSGENLQKVYLDGKDVSNEIRTKEVDSYVAKFAALKEVRDKVTPMQQKMGDNQDIVMEGRDIGTTVFPNADVKIFLDASIEERANRRYKQNIQKGINCDYKEIYEAIKERHILETTREISPLIQADDAIYLDSSSMQIDQVVNEIIKIINKVR